MGAPVPLKNASDSYVSEKFPSKNYNSVNKLFLADGSAADTRFAFIYFGMPSGLVGTTVLSAKLRLYSGAGFGGSVTLTAQRLAAKFSANRINWNNRPATTGSSVAVTKSNAAAGMMWEFDVTSLIQSIANGAPWYGWRISATGSGAKWLYSAQALDQFRPTLEITWSDAPDTPERLIPDGDLAVSVEKPTLQWDFVDPSGDQTMQSAHIRFFSTEALADANASGDVYDASVPLTFPEFDLDATTGDPFPSIPADATRWWRVLNVDGAGLPSGWSAPASFKRITKGTLTITNPAAGTTPFVNDNTPPFSWTFTGRTQQKYEVILCTPETPADWIWTSGILTSTDAAVTPPEGKIVTVGKTYRLIVRVYDDQPRVAVPDDPIYVEAVRDFVYQFAGSVAPPTSLTVTLDNTFGTARLDWVSSTAPDEFVLLRDGKEFLTDQPVDLLVSGTNYRYVDGEASPKKQHVWEVARKVNGVTSSGNPTFTGTTKVLAPLLSQVNGGKPVLFLNPNVDAERVESSDIHYILGDAPPVMITQSIRGYEGTVSGVLANNAVPGLTADQMLANLEWFKENPGTVVKFIWVNKVMKVVVRNITDEPISYPDGTVEYLASFDLFEVGF